MTNHSERLDEILNTLGERYIMVEHRLIHLGIPEQNGKNIETRKAKQAILRWVADEVIKVPIDYSMSPDGYSVDMGVAERRMSAEQLKILAQHGYKGGE